MAMVNDNVSDDDGEVEDGDEDATCAVGGRPGFRLVLNPAVGMLECCMPCNILVFVKNFMMIVRVVNVIDQYFSPLS